MLKLLLLLAVFLLHFIFEVEGYVPVPPCLWKPLGIESKKIPNSDMTASSSFDKYHLASRGRLNIKREGKFRGAWSAKYNNKRQFLLVDLGELTMVTGIATQGRADFSQWVTEYKVFYGPSYHSHFEQYNQTFKGNTDQSTVVRHLFNPAIIARYIKIKPLAWHGHISMRIELYGCPQVHGINVTCSSTHMMITIAKKILHGLHPQDVHLNDHNCTSKLVTIHGHHFYKLKTALTGCGTVKSHTTKLIHYANRVSETALRPGQVITRLRQVLISFTCSYYSHRVATARGLKPDQSVLEYSEHEKGDFPLKLDIFKNATYEIKFPHVHGHPIKVKLRKRIYLQLNLTSGDPRLYIRALHCYGTPNKDPYSTPQYSFIKHACPVDTTVIVYSRTHNHIERFSLLTFRLLKHFKYVFFHCKVKICHGKTGICAKTCPSIGKREISAPLIEDDSMTHIITHGPFTLDDSDKQDQEIDALTSDKQDQETNALTSNKQDQEIDALTSDKKYQEIDALTSDKQGEPFVEQGMVQIMADHAEEM